MSAPRVSVVVATRDRPVMLREALRGIRDQALPGAVETVVVYDQAEPDPTLVSLDARRPVRVVRNARSPGLAGARNTGIEASRGELVAFCDDDDYWLPGRLARQVAALTTEPDAVLATCGIRVEYDGASFARVLPQTSVTFDALLRDRHTELHPSTFLLRRAALLGPVGLVDEQVPGGFGEDYEFLLRIARRHPVVNVPEALVVVRWGKQSFFFRRWETMRAGLSWLLERYPEFDTCAAGSARVHGQIAFANAALGERGEAARWARRSLRRNPREPRAYLALAVATGLVRPDTVMETLHRQGRGI